MQRMHVLSASPASPVTPVPPCVYISGYAARKRYAELRRHRAATTLQRYERMRQSRIRFLELRSATVTVQTAWRGAMARDLYKRMRRENAAVRMQVRGSGGCEAPGQAIRSWEGPLSVS